MNAIPAPRSTPVGRLGREGERIAAELRRLEGRVTPAKVGVVAALSTPTASPVHLTARELRAATADFGIQLDEATIYRTVARLEAQHLLHSVAVHRATLYGLNQPAHHHAICDRCGALRSIPATDLDELVTQAFALAGFEVGHQRAVTLRGTCGGCAETVTAPPVVGHRPSPTSGG